MQYDMYGNPIPTLTQQTSLLGFDPSTKNRPMLMPVKEDGSWTAPEWFHSMSKLPAGMLSMAKGQPFSISAGELAEGGLNFAGMGGGTTMARGGTPSNVMGTFGGGGAFGKDKEALKIAKEQIKWDSPYATWRKTGWFKDNDGVWKFEIDDASSRFRMKPSVLYPDVPKIASDAEMTMYLGKIHPDAPRVSDFFHHPDLYGNYPNLSNAQIVNYEGGNLAAFARPQKENPFGTLMLDEIMRDTKIPQEGLHSTVLHELQHGIQNLEPKFGQAFGKAHFQMNPPARIQQQGAMNEIFQKWLSYLDQDYTGEVKPSFDDFWDSRYMGKDNVDALHASFPNLDREDGHMLKRFMGDWIQNTLGASPDSSPKDLKRWLRKARQDHDDIGEIGRYGKNPATSAWQTKGEMEARNVQERFLMPEEIRKYHPPWQTEGDYRNTSKLLRFEPVTEADMMLGMPNLYHFPREHGIQVPKNFPDLNTRLGILGDR